MQSETLRFAGTGFENFKDTFAKMQQGPQFGQEVRLVQNPKGPLLPQLFGEATVTELFEGVRVMTYQIREKHNRQLLATLDVKRIHLERVPPHPDRLNGLRVRISWTEPALSIARGVLVWLAMNFDVEPPTWLAVADAEEQQAGKEAEPKRQSPLTRAHEPRRGPEAQRIHGSETGQALAHNSQSRATQTVQEALG